jgi:hypothetical protein
MVKRLFTPQSLLIIASTIVALLVFNVSRPGLKNELLSSFDTWYQESSPALLLHTDAPYQGRNITVTVRSFRGNGSSTNSSAINNHAIDNEWKLPSGSLSDIEQRMRLARVLQLISESQVFGLRPLTNPRAGGSYLAIVVVDPTRTFETTISFDEVKGNIQLQNLLKLLEVFATTPPPAAMNPSQL